ncbi:MAG TPA: hypothetical protein VEC13_00460 [Candidatus Paceibacterota bacterium]|nr:hypothetical protein [Candidatus Paceibacterota bacterium]
MKIHVLNHNALTRTLLATVRFTPDQTEVASMDEADVIITTDVSNLRKVYREDKFFGFIAIREFEKEKAKPQPKNIFVMSGEDMLGNHENGVRAFKQAFDNWLGATKTDGRTSNAGSAMDIVVFDKSYFVLVVDDSSEHLSEAAVRLVGQQLILAQGPEDALRYLNLGGRMPDAVLTDLQMRPDKVYGALDLDRYGVTETVHNGFSVMFEATRRGIPVAIVTDGNHHLDWASAMFDYIKRAEVNGQPVLFFNDIGKQWDVALKALLELK